jgi:MOSC domain-containing protein YiiM
VPHSDLSRLESAMPWLLDAPAEQGQVEMLVVRPRKNQRKTLSQVLFSPQQGVVGDNWFDDCWKKQPTGESAVDVQVAIMNVRVIELLAESQAQWPLAGDQLFVDFDLSVNNLSVGDYLQVGGAVLKISAEPHRGCCKFKQRFGADALSFVNSTQGDQHRLRGVYASIVRTGEVCVGDLIRKVAHQEENT